MSGLNSIYDSDPERYDQLRHCWLNVRRTAFIAERLKNYHLQEGAHVVELGSGTGALTGALAARFPQFNFTGIEPIPGYVDYALEQNTCGNAQFIQGTAENIPHDVSFDLLLSNDVLHHVRSMRESVARVTKQAHPGCRWLLIEPNARNLYAFLGQALKPGERNFWPRPFLKLVLSHKWVHLGTEYLFLIPPFVRQPPRWLKSLELGIEGFSLLGGGVALELVMPADPGR